MKFTRKVLVTAGVVVLFMPAFWGCVPEATFLDEDVFADMEYMYEGVDVGFETGPDLDEASPTEQAEAIPLPADIEWPQDFATSSQHQAFFEILTGFRWEPDEGAAQPFPMSFSEDGVFYLYEETERHQFDYEIKSLVAAPGAYSALISFDGSISSLVIVQPGDDFHLVLTTPHARLEGIGR